MNSPTISVFVTSVGRRNYLVDWFRSASPVVGVGVKVITGDSDPAAPAMGTGDASVVLPPIGTDDYVQAVAEACRSLGVRLLVSVNDYEIATLSRFALMELDRVGVVAAVAPPSTMNVVEDKFRTFEALQRAGIAVPETVLADEVMRFDSGVERFVVKHRFGSGSSGLFVVDKSLLSHSIAIASATAPDPSGFRVRVPCPRHVVVQEKVEGDEYGIDVVTSFDGMFRGVLARRKLRMRSGETDRAITVDPDPFIDVGYKLASEFRLCGITDVDVIVTSDGTPVVIDINPRFGGGYPFSHLAGANLPACYVAWAAGLEAEDEWLRCESGIEGSKYAAIRRVER